VRRDDRKRRLWRELRGRNRRKDKLLELGKKETSADEHQGRRCEKRGTTR